MGKTKKGAITATCSYPPYCIKWIGEKHFMVGGGGGASKTGVPNKFEVYEMKQGVGGRETVVERVTEHDTGAYPVMNAAVGAAPSGKNYILAAGLDQYLQLYSLKYRVVKPKDGAAPEAGEGVKKRKDAKKDAGNAASTGTPSRSVTVAVQEADARVQTDNKDVQKSVAFSPDTSVIATGGSDGHLRVWKNPGLTKVHDIDAHADIISSVEFSPDGKQLVTISFDKKATVWTVKTGKRFCDLNWLYKTERPYRFRVCKYFTQTDKSRVRLCTAHIPVQVSRPPPSYLTLWETDAYKMQLVKKTSVEIICSMAVSSDGVFLATGGAEGSVTVFASFNLGQLYQVRNAHKSVVTDLCFAPQPKRPDESREFSLLSVCPDHDIRLHENSRGLLFSPLWAVVGFIIVIYLFFLFITTAGL